MICISVGEDWCLVALESPRTGETAPRAFVCPIPPSGIGPKSFHSHLDFDQSSPGLHSSLSLCLLCVRELHSLCLLITPRRPTYGTKVLHSSEILKRGEAKTTG